MAKSVLACVEMLLNMIVGQVVYPFVPHVPPKAHSDLFPTWTEALSTQESCHFPRISIYPLTSALLNFPIAETFLMVAPTPCFNNTKKESRPPRIRKYVHFRNCSLHGSGPHQRLSLVLKKQYVYFLRSRIHGHNKCKMASRPEAVHF